MSCWFGKHRQIPHVVKLKLAEWTNFTVDICEKPTMAKKIMPNIIDEKLMTCNK